MIGKAIRKRGWINIRQEVIIKVLMTGITKIVIMVLLIILININYNLKYLHQYSIS